MFGKDREPIRELASRWMELASQPVMEERARLWTALKDLHAERPMVLFETWTVENYVREEELVCENEVLRQFERSMRQAIRQVEEIGDDYVLEPFYRVVWEYISPDYGVDLHFVRAEDNMGGNLGFHYNHPIKTPGDVARLKHGTWKIDRTQTLANAKILEDAIGDILPVRIQGTDGFLPYLTGDLYKLIGNDNLLTWLYDAPETVHQAMAFLRDDRLMLYEWLEAENMLGLNNNSIIVGSGSPGYVSSLPQPDYAGRVRLKDIWVWSESQETTMISPRMFGEFFLPYIAEVASRFGKVYYGCCDPVHDRWEIIQSAIPHIGAVSISPWCDQRIMGEKLGKHVVYSRKPKPWLISGEAPDWEGLRKDVDETLQAAQNCNLEIIYRDVYRIHEDRPRLKRWVDLVRSRMT
jgi:hypothetical protein